jgi:hypothetical protein
MFKRAIMVLTLVGALVFSSNFASAAGQERKQQRVQAQKQEQEQIFGSQIMTEQERAEFRAKMRAAKTNEEREKVRSEHHALMKERAKERGVTLPDEPPVRGKGQGLGPGGGMGSGGGTGSGGAGKGFKGGRKQ